MDKLGWLFKKTLLTELSYKLNNLLRMADIFAYVLIFYFLSRIIDQAALPALQPYGGEYFPFILFGLALNWYHREAQHSFAANLRDEQMLGTLEALVATRTPVPLILAGFSLFDFCLVTVQVGILLIVSFVFLGVQVVWSNFFLAMAILILSLLAFIGFGFISAAFVLVFKRGDPLGWVVNNLSALLGGVYYPIEVLPGWLQKLSLLLPLTHSVKAMRLVLLKGAGLAEVRNEMLILAAFAVTLLPFSLICLRYALKKVTVEGTLTGY